MATTANPQRSTASVRGNHPAGRALRGAAAELRAVPVPAADEDAPSADVLAFPVGGRSARGEVSVPVRLTRRGRRVAAGLVVVGGLGMAALAGPAVLGTPAGSGLALAGESSVVVQPGDTLWSIAGDIAPDEDPRGVVDALQAANDLRSSDLVPGQVLLVP